MYELTIFVFLHPPALSITGCLRSSRRGIGHSPGKKKVSTDIQAIRLLWINKRICLTRLDGVMCWILSNGGGGLCECLLFINPSCPSVSEDLPHHNRCWEQMRVDKWNICADRSLTFLINKIVNIWGIYGFIYYLCKKKILLMQL